MGLETAAVASMAGGNLLGSFMGDATNRRNARAQQGRQREMDAMGKGMMVAPGSNRYQLQIDELLKTLGFDPIEAPTIEADTIDMDSILPDMNVGNDSLMQMLRADPMTQLDPTATSFLRDTITSGGNPFDTSGMFEALGTVDRRNIDDQVADLIASTSGGGLGERFGTAMASRGSRLRERALQDIGARNAGIQQSSYEAGQGRVTSAANNLNQVMQSLMGLKTNAANVLNSGLLTRAGMALQGATANQNARNTASAQNADNFLETSGMNIQQKNMLFQQQLQGILQAAGLLQGDRNFNAGIFQTLAGQPAAGMQTPSSIPGAIGDIGTYMLLLSQMGGKGGKGGAKSGAQSWL